ncbi:Stromal interaction molecule-like [Oopsacas minuta]|uniref:Stromal interaction molecule-like n=1 Tax=Oopsacas minuta TaxID=111878 RepID=A0AAV7KHX4_9METZ|nr:Stromal interaction molecule-like [Oopsacas minuta]
MKLISTFLIFLICCYFVVFLTNSEDIVEEEWLSIEQFHRKLDTDEDGTIRQDEVIEDMNDYNNLQETKLKMNFDETPLSLRSLMQQWTQNPVRSWTPVQVAHWAKVTVKMPEILGQIHEKKVSGMILPTMAVDRDQLMRIFPGLDQSQADRFMLYAFKLVISGPSDNEIPSLYDDSNQDWVAFEHIVVFFKEMDKDDDGCVDLDEADGVRDEPSDSTNTPCDEISIEHRTLSEVWEYWSKVNIVRDWTVEEVGAWLDQEGLGKYIEVFAAQKVVGLHMPKIAANPKTGFLRELNVNKEDRKKLMISAISLVLFGPPKVMSRSNLLADTLFAILCIFISAGALWYGNKQRVLKNQFESKFVESENSLDEIKSQLQELNEIGKSIDEKQDEISDITETTLLSPIESTSEERVVIKYQTPDELISLLRFTYLREYEFYDIKKQDIELLIDKARRQHDSLKRKHGNILSALFISNTRVLDNNEVLMVDTKSRLDRLTHDMQELNQRWQKMESITQTSLIQHSSSRRCVNENSYNQLGSQNLLNNIGSTECLVTDANNNGESLCEIEMLRSTSCPKLNINAPGADAESERRKKTSFRKSITKPIKKYITSDGKRDSPTEGENQ